MVSDYKSDYTEDIIRIICGIEIVRFGNREMEEKRENQ